MPNGVPPLDFDDLAWFVRLIEDQALETMEIVETAPRGTWEYENGALETHHQVRNWLQQPGQRRRGYMYTISDLFASAQCARGAIRVASEDEEPLVGGNCVLQSLLTLIVADLVKVPEPHYVYRQQTNERTFLDRSYDAYRIYRHANHLDQRLPMAAISGQPSSEGYPYDLLTKGGRASALEDFVLYPVVVTLSFHRRSTKCEETANAAHALVALFDAIRGSVRGVISGGREPGSYLINYGIGAGREQVDSYFARREVEDTGSDSDDEA